jgi:hypothetical protein
MSLLLLAALLAPQDTVRWSAPSCDGCRVELAQAGRLGPFDGRTNAKAIARDSRGRFIVAQPTPAVFVLDRRGRKVGTLGRSGEGPGEYQAPRTVVVLAGDTVVVLDPRLRRANLYDPAGRFVRTFVTPSGSGAGEAVAYGRGILMSAIDLSPQGAGFPLHELTSDGGYRKWADARPIVVPDVGNLSDRYLAAAGKRVWAQHARLEPVVAELGAGGKVHRLFLRDASWYERLTPAELTERIQSGSRQPHSLGAGVWEGDGILWVLWQVGDKRWESALSAEQPTVDGVKQRRIEDPTRYWDMYLEAVDVETGSLLASARIDRTLAGFTADGLLIGWHETDAGPFVAELFRPRLVRSPSRRTP